MKLYDNCGRRRSRWGLMQTAVGSRAHITHMKHSARYISGHNSIKSFHAESCTYPLASLAEHHCYIGLENCQDAAINVGSERSHHSWNTQTEPAMPVYHVERRNAVAIGNCRAVRRASSRATEVQRPSLKLKTSAPREDASMIMSRSPAMAVCLL